MSVSLYDSGSSPSYISLDDPSPSHISRLLNVLASTLVSTPTDGEPHSSPSSFSGNPTNIDTTPSSSDSNHPNPLPASHQAIPLYIDDIILTASPVDLI